MLGKTVLKQRVEAARTLRGISQTDLDLRFAQDGLGKAAGRIERGELVMQRAHRDAFCRHLGVPERWFSEPDVDIVVGLRPAKKLSPAELLADLELLLADLDRDGDRDGRGTKKAPVGEDRRDPPGGAARS